MSVEKPVEQIEPSDISTQRHFQGAFGNFESEEVARDIVQFCREAGGWKPFTRAEIALVQARRRKSPPAEKLIFYFLVTPVESDDLFHILRYPRQFDDNSGWIRKISDNPETFQVTEEFILRCYQASCRPTSL